MISVSTCFVGSPGKKIPPRSRAKGEQMGREGSMGEGAEQASSLAYLVTV